MSAARAQAAGRGQPGWLRGLGCGVVMMLSPATALLLVVLLSPSVLMRVVDREPDRAASRTVFLANLAGSVGAIVALWRDGLPAIGSAVVLLAQPATLATAWTAAAAGWLGSELVGQVALLWLNAASRREARAVQARLAELVAEWGEPPPPDR